jgi:hypothetical protein
VRYQIRLKAGLGIDRNRIVTYRQSKLRDCFTAAAAADAEGLKKGRFQVGGGADPGGLGLRGKCSTMLERKGQTTETSFKERSRQSNQAADES